MNLFPETGSVAVRQATVTVSVIPVITQDIGVVEPFFTSFWTDWISEMNSQLMLFELLVKPNVKLCYFAGMVYMHNTYPWSFTGVIII